MNCTSSLATLPRQHCARASRSERQRCSFSSRHAVGAWHAQSRAALTSGLRRRGAVARQALSTRADKDYGQDTYTEVPTPEVNRHLVDYFTYKALRMTLAELQETDVTPMKQEYRWLYEFATNVNPSDSERFIRLLLKDRQDLGQRIMTKRLVLLQRWMKNFRPPEMNEFMEEQNKKHLLERLMSSKKDSVGAPECEGESCKEE